MAVPTSRYSSLPTTGETRRYFLPNDLSTIHVGVRYRLTPIAKREIETGTLHHETSRYSISRYRIRNRQTEDEGDYHSNHHGW